MYRLSKKVTGCDVKKIFSLILAVLMITASLGACKQDGSDKKGTSAKSSTASKTTAKAGATTPKSSSTAKAGTATGNKATGTQSSSDAGAISSNTGDSQTVAENNSDGSGSQGNNTGNTDTNTDTGIIPEEKIDLGGRTLVVADWMDLRLFDPDAAGVGGSEGKARYDAARYVEQKYNCKIEWKKIKKGITEYVNAAMAGVYFADAFMTMRQFAFPVPANSNLLLPINDIIDFEHDPLWQGRGKTSTWKYKIYGLQAQVNYPYEGIWYNYDFIQREGMTDPYDLYKAGNWNWETFLNLAIQATKDINGDGITDQWGITPRRQDFLCEDFIYSNGSTMVELMPDGVNFKLTISDPRNVKPLQFVSDLYNTYKVVNPTGWYTEFIKGTSAFYHTQLWEGTRFKDAGLTCGYVPFPKGPDSTADIINYRSDPLFLAFPSSVEKPSEVVKAFATMMAVWDESKPYYFPESNTLNQYSETYLAPQFLERDKEYVFAANKYYTPHDINVFGDAYKIVRDNVFNKIVGQETTVAAALESIAGPAQEAINNVIDAN